MTLKKTNFHFRYLEKFKRKLKDSNLILKVLDICYFTFSQSEVVPMHW